MFVEVVLPAPLAVERDDVEDALADVFGEAGEVTGAGMGRASAVLDLEVTAPLSVTDATASVLEALGRSGIQLARFRIDAGPWTEFEDTT